MSFIRTLPRAAIAFWISQVVCLVILWNLLPNQLTSILLVLLVATNGVLLSRRVIELPTFSSVAFLLSVIHVWLSGGFINPVLASALIFLGVALLGLAGRSLTGRIDSEDVTAWFIIGLFVAQIATFTQYWPVSFFQKAALGLTIFYLLWQMWGVIDPQEGAERPPIMSHFVFVILAVMVIVTTIAWTTWPGLSSY